MPLVMVLTTEARRFCIAPRSSVKRADFDAVHRELVFGALEQFGGFQQRLRGDAAGIQAGAAEGVGAVGVLPLIDARHFQFVLAGANRRRIAGGPRADHDHII